MTAFDEKLLHSHAIREKLLLRSEALLNIVMNWNNR
jgi:hypothetical protein